MDCSIDKSILNKTAVKKLETAKPSISLSARRIIIAFITNRKSPKVIIVTGKVKRIKNGFIRRFNTDKTTATINALT